ncbi:MAG TPA: redoxin domain-containing protein [Candidatus Tumulicola sp.]|jgi:peroxiredoxin
MLRSTFVPYARPAAIALALGMAACSHGASTDAPKTAAAPLTNAAKLAIGQAAPAFSATALDGTKVSLADYRGKVLVLNFWATWCPPCRAETPDMIRAAHKIAAKDVALLGIDTTETAPIVKSFVALKGIPYRVALAGPDAYNAFGISYIPTTVVVGPDGIVRARWTGPVTPDQVALYVAGARAGKNAEYLTPEQRRLDAMLAVSQFSFGGNPASVKREVERAQARLADVSKYLDVLSAAPAPRYDFERTQPEQGALALAAGQAALTVAATAPQRAAADLAIAGAYGDLNQFADAVRVYRQAIALSPQNPALIEGLTLAYYRLHDYAGMRDTASTWTKLAPKNPDAWDQLGLAYQRSQDFHAAVVPYQRALALMIDQARGKPIGAKGEAVAEIADESLDLANVYVALGDSSNAQRIFEQARQYAARIPDGSSLAVLKTRVRERTLEGMSGVALARDSGVRLALTPWTGPGLPGSLGSSYRYRLVAVAPAGTVVHLGTKGLREGWVSSFCQDRLCSPNSVTFTMPGEGLKTYEFQLVPPSAGATPGRVWVGTQSTWVTTT